MLFVQCSRRRPLNSNTWITERSYILRKPPSKLNLFRGHCYMWTHWKHNYAFRCLLWRLLPKRNRFLDRLFRPIQPKIRKYVPNHHIRLHSLRWICPRHRILCGRLLCRGNHRLPFHKTPLQNGSILSFLHLRRCRHGRRKTTNYNFLRPKTRISLTSEFRSLSDSIQKRIGKIW